MLTQECPVHIDPGDLIRCPDMEKDPLAFHIIHPLFGKIKMLFIKKHTLIRPFIA